MPEKCYECDECETTHGGMMNILYVCKITGQTVSLHGKIPYWCPKKEELNKE